MKKSLVAKVLLSAAALTTTLASSHASAEWNQWFPGTICQPGSPSDASCMGYTQYGVHNTCSTTIAVDCPMPVVFSPTYIREVTMVAYDRSAVENIECWLLKTASNGDVTYQRYNSTSPYSDRVRAEQVNFLSPDGFPGTTGFWRLRCFIPGVAPAGFSHISSIFMLI